MPYIERNVRFGDPRIPGRLWKFIYPQENGCWLWSGQNCRGYGMTNWNGSERWYVHRVFYTVFVGPITEETIDHACRMRQCCNPSHLSQMSMKENNRTSNPQTIRLMTKTHCKRGHPLTEDGSRKGERDVGRRSCRKCINRWQRDKAFAIWLRKDFARWREVHGTIAQRFSDQGASQRVQPSRPRIWAG